MLGLYKGLLIARRRQGGSPLLCLYRELVSGRRGDAPEAVRSTSAYAGTVCCTERGHLLGLGGAPGQTRGKQALIGIALFWLAFVWQRATELSLRKFQTVETVGWACSVERVELRHP